MKYCIPAPPFSEVVWPPGKTSYYPIPPRGYFNLNPKAFGLDFTIFTKLVTVTYTVVDGTRVLTTLTSGDWASQASLTHFPPPSSAPTPVVRHRALKMLNRRDDTIIPAVCYASCNNCYIEAQRVGKSPAICLGTSRFSVFRANCDDCVVANGDIVKRSQQTYFNPRIQEIVGFCSGPSAEPVTTSQVVVEPEPVTTSTPVVETPTPSPEPVTTTPIPSPEPFR